MGGEEAIRRTATFNELPVDLSLKSTGRAWAERISSVVCYGRLREDEALKALR